MLGEWGAGAGCRQWGRYDRVLKEEEEEEEEEEEDHRGCRRNGSTPALQHGRNERAISRGKEPVPHAAFLASGPA